MTYSTAIDRKWQKYWEEIDLASFDDSKLDNKKYVLEMFSYPSGAKLHVGHWYNYGLADIWARMKKLQGYEVFQPMGFDAFGLPAENYAIKTGIHPETSTLQNIATMEEQLKRMGGMFNWEHEIATCLPEYYRWNQWLFLQLYKHGLAYRKKAPVNWCTKCNTVLANEQVTSEHTCDRCGSTVVKKQLTQWFFKITDYAQELLDCLPDLDWPEKTKRIQQNWIGRSEGAEIVFTVEKDGELLLKDGNPVELRVFTTRADTLPGVSYVVLAPENELCDLVTTAEQATAVKEYQQETAKASEIDRLSSTREKTGVFTGSYAVHPQTGAKVPLWAADYVIASYGTGVVMAVPAHDERDFTFATKYNLPITQVIVPADEREVELPFCEDGIVKANTSYDGITSAEARHQMISDLAKENKGEQKINYRLRDWLVSRQRYWGTPIPMIYCPNCGEVPVPESDLPVRLPKDVDFTPDGDSPLKKCRSFMETTCPCCGGKAERDPDTLDTFVCSSWYQFRYVDNKNEEAPFSKEKVNKYCPVDKYVGGAEHAAMHLLYSRFITKALRDMGYLNFSEPFLSLVHQGTILGADGSKMSKSLGNTVSPDPYIEQYGADVFRAYLAFGFNYVEGGPWSDSGIKATAKFIARVERLIEKLMAEKPADLAVDQLTPAMKKLNYVLHFAIKSVTEDAERFQFNTSIARLMELLNALGDFETEIKDLTGDNLVQAQAFEYQVVSTMMILLAPFAPHFCEEMWEKLGKEPSIFWQKWPVFDPKALVKDEIEIAIQCNGKLVGRTLIPSGASADEVEKLISTLPEFTNWTADKTLRKFIYVPKRLVNLVLG